MNTVHAIVPNDRQIKQSLMPILVREGVARRLLGMSLPKFRKLVREKHIPHVWDGGQKRYLVCELEDFAKSLPRERPESSIRDDDNHQEKEASLCR